LTSPGGWDVFAAKLDPSGNVVWARNNLTLGKPAEGSTAIAVDSAGNAYLADTVPLMSNVYPGDVLIFRLDGGNGATPWTDQIVGKTQKNGTILGDFENPVLTVAGGNVYVAGSLYGTVDFDPGPGTSYVSGSSTTVVLKLTTGGAFVWADAFQGVSAQG